MIKAIFYKEWIKTRRSVFLLSFITLGLIIYTFINTGQIFRINEANGAWGLIIQQDMSLVPAVMKWFLIFAPILIAIDQFVAEITDKRLKLTMHLPVKESKVILSMLLYGFTVSLGISMVLFLALNIGFSFYYASEILCAMMLKLLPYSLAGLTGYFLVS